MLVKILKSSAVTALLAAAMIPTPATTANAQIFPGDWRPQRAQAANTTVYRVPVSDALNPGEIYVSHTDKRLYFVTARGQALSYPIAAPRPEDVWQGVMRITKKAVNPSWTPTAEMRRDNPRLPAFVPGGHPQNPLGSHALYLGTSLYRIHGTDAPWTIGRPVSRGCIRMHNAHVAHLYNRIPVGTRVTVMYRSLRPQRRQRLSGLW
jgi:lipoprotein-anchoring transpeptidase ErfK/SrfK